ncbi:chondroitin proteoglycan 2-like [Actinia tenebrosa]|uniref:Chondroitin proteoglycan 2-like n=1 Tax=Actinia tenebrosa TaxID=6105 RepID=A0A6P8J980_ACTTE|nr:chondroitin proteoglycan 2-like [Actinia tenebrosa]
MLRVSLIFGVFLHTISIVRGYPGNFCSNKVNGNYPDSAKCNGYIACSNGITYHMPCPAGLVWNKVQKMCDWKRNVPPPCGTLTLITSSPTPGPVTTPAPDSFTCAGKTDGNYPDPNNCHGYIACANGIKYHMPCPAELKWNDRQKRCDWPKYAYPACGVSSSSGPSYSCKVQVISNNFCSGKANGNYPDPSNCHGYIACSNDLIYHMPCPAQLKWNDRQKRCDWPKHAYPACSGVTPTPTIAPTTISGGVGGNFCQKKANGNYPDPNNCFGYIACSNGFTYHMPCPASLKWNDNQKRCDWPKYANPGCSGAHQWPCYICVCPNGNCQSNFCSNKVNGNYPDSAKCNGYIACSNGITYHMPCPAGLVWNKVQKMCDWKRNVPPPCGNLNIVPTTSSSCSDILSVECCDVIQARNDCGGVVGLYCRKSCKRC